MLKMRELNIKDGTFLFRRVERIIHNIPVGVSWFFILYIYFLCVYISNPCMFYTTNISKNGNLLLYSILYVNLTLI